MRLRNLILISLFIFFLGGSPPTLLRAQEATGTPANASGTPSITREDLEALIKVRARDLENVNRQLETVEGNLRTTRDQKSTLTREVKTLDYSIRQLELNIRADGILAQKLGLEIDSLNYDVRDIEFTIEAKREGIVRLIQQLQRKEEDGLLTIFLKNESLADGVLETQSLTNLRAQLALDITSLRSLHEDLNAKLDAVNEKRGAVDLHQKNLKTRKFIVQDQKEERKTILAQTQNKETIYEQQLEDLKKQQDAIEDEISQVEDRLRSTFNVSILPTQRHGMLLWPVQMANQGGKGQITQHFGEKSYLYRYRPHNGLDIGAPIGTPVFAVDDGVVTAVGSNDVNRWRKYQYGKYVLIRHPNNLATLYAHLSRQTVQEGTQVRRGDLVGYVGNTGYATGAHLHFGVYWAPSILMKSIPPAAGLVPIGVIVNPENYL